MPEFNNLNIFLQQSKSYLNSIPSKSVKVEDEKINYFEAGSGETLLFFHCFNGSKALWRILANRLQDKYHVVIPDIPGFGMEDNLSKKERFSFRYIIEILNKFTKALDLNRFHIISASAGSTLAASYTIKHAEKVISLSMYGLPTLFRETPEICCNSDKPIDFFVPITLKGQQALNEHLIYGPGRVSNWLMARSIELNRRNRDFKINVLNEALKNTSLIVPRLRQLDLPILFIYGEADNVTPLRTIEHFSAVAPNVQCYRIPNAGHMVYIEKADEVSAIYKSFLKFISLEAP
ncbi:MAG: alpha/beta hydrolase [Pseudomonadales bacterium]|nr:alpha/beta hydrolase [Pseudomonadales bacterium]